MSGVAAVQVEPFNRALKTLQCDVMINGRRRDHGFERAHLELLEEGAPIKCNPLAWWEFKDCWDYIHKQGLQYHPLHDEVGIVRNTGLPANARVPTRRTR